LQGVLTASDRNESDVKPAPKSSIATRSPMLRSSRSNYAIFRSTI